MKEDGRGKTIWDKFAHTFGMNLLGWILSCICISTCSNRPAFMRVASYHINPAIIRMHDSVISTPEFPILGYSQLRQYMLQTYICYCTKGDSLTGQDSHHWPITLLSCVSSRTVVPSDHATTYLIYADASIMPFLFLKLGI